MIYNSIFHGVYACNSNLIFSFSTVHLCDANLNRHALRPNKKIGILAQEN